MDKGIYIFSAIQLDHQRDFGTSTFNSEENPIYTIKYKNHAMVVTNIYDEVLPTRENLFEHQRVISKLMDEFTIIPFSFGSVFHSEKDILLLLESLHENFKDLFPKLENKIEVGLKIFGKENWFESKLNQEKELIELNKEISSKSDEESFYDKVQLGDMAQKFYQKLQTEIYNEIFKPLEKIAESSLINESITDKLLLNASFLVDCDKEKEFDDMVNKIYEKWEEDLDFNYTGPWAPYNFVKIKLKIDGSYDS